MEATAPKKRGRPVGRPRTNKISFTARMHMEVVARLVAVADERAEDVGVIMEEALGLWFAAQTERHGELVDLHPQDNAGRKRLLEACGWDSGKIATLMSSYPTEDEWASALVMARMLSGAPELKRWTPDDLAILQGRRRAS